MGATVGARLARETVYSRQSQAQADFFLTAIAVGHDAIWIWVGCVKP